MLVDEYQDTNHAQYVLVRELVGAHAGAHASPDGPGPGGSRPPSCASWVTPTSRSTPSAAPTIRNIVEFEQDFPDARVILLEQNYRSTQNILSAANAVVSRNAGRKPKNSVVRPGRRTADHRVRRRQ